MEIGWGWQVAALAVVGLTGCFNPGAGSDGEATLATTGGPSTTTGSASEPMNSSEGPGPTDTGGPGPTTSTTGDPTTGDVCMSACSATTGTDTGTDTGSEGTTGEPPVVGEPVGFMPTQVIFAGAFGVVALNFDGDALLEVFVTSASGNNVAVAYDAEIESLSGFGGPLSSAVVTLDLAAYPAEEVAVASGGMAGLITTYYLDAGTVMVSAAIPLPAGCKDPQTMVAGLITADADPDLVVGCDDFGAKALVFKGNPDGKFHEPLEIPLAAKPTTLALFPVVGTPLLDLVVAGDGGVTVYEGMGMGMFAGVAAESFAMATPQGLGAGRIDTDGLLDVVVGQQTPGQCTVLIGDATGLKLGKVDICGPFAHDVAVADLNQDGFADLISAHDDGLHLGFSQGDGTFALPVIYATPEARRLAVADLNNDQKLDIVMTSEDTVTLYTQQ